MRRRPAWSVAMAGLAMALLSVDVIAQYPARSVRIVLPYAAGGGADVLTRLVAQGLAEMWKQAVVVENRPGAGATIGTDVVAKATPDGYTLLLTASTMAVSPAAYPRLPYDVLRDFTPITLVAESPYVLAVHPGLKVESLSDLLKLAAATPGKLNFGSPGTGTISHLAFELLRSTTGMQATMVPYKGSSPAIMAAVSGQVDFVMNSPPAVMELARAGKLRALAVTSARRSANVPNLPTVRESGVPDFDVTTWFGLLGPAALPREVLHRIHDDTGRVLANPALVERFGKEGFEPRTLAPDAFAAYLRSEVQKWGDIVRRGGIRFD